MPRPECKCCGVKYGGSINSNLLISCNCRGKEICFFCARCKGHCVCEALAKQIPIPVWSPPDEPYNP